MSTIKLYPQDTVALATADLKKGETVVVDGQSIVLLDDIPNAHKIALKDFETGEAIRKYDNIIGYASRPIKKGEWIHEHNEVTGLGKSKEYTYEFNPVSIFPGTTDETFMGYDRGEHGAGIRNHLAIISTVFCANGPLRKLSKMAEEKYPATENFDGVIAFDQQFGFAGPTFRLSSNTALATRKKNWIDYDAGRLLTAKTPEEVEALNQELYDAVMATVNGQYHTRTEENGYYIMGALKDGVTL